MGGPAWSGRCEETLLVVKSRGQKGRSARMFQKERRACAEVLRWEWPAEKPGEVGRAVGGPPFRVESYRCLYLRTCWPTPALQ